MNNQEILRLALLNLYRRKPRTFLTMLGVVIGCCSIVIMISLGIGMKQSQEKLLSEMGDLTIITVTDPKGGRGTVKLNDAAVKELKRIPRVSAVMPRISLDDYNFSVKLYAGAGNRYFCEWVTVSGLKSDEMDLMGYSRLAGTEIGKSGEVLTGQYLAYSFADSLKPPGNNTVDRFAGGQEEGKRKSDIPSPFFIC